ncbi:MAG TPA: hypothetical protein VD772_11010, partial [Anseongella sp.]|nr:hypothetical protein [Anseongella sp.]
EELAVFAFNSSRSESDLSYLEGKALENALAGDNLSIAGQGPPEKLTGGSSGTALWKYCVVLALIFLGAEILLIKLWPVRPKI